MYSKSMSFPLQNFSNVFDNLGRQISNIRLGLVAITYYLTWLLLFKLSYFSNWLIKSTNLYLKYV